jgi:integrase
MGDVEPFLLHDLRRTAATQMAEIGIAPQVVEKVLNHKSGMIRGVAAIYNRHEYRAEQCAALLAWGERLRTIVGAPTGAYEALRPAIVAE